MSDNGPCVFKRHNIEDLSEADARAIFGDGVYEAWLRWRAEPRRAGTLTVTAIDRGAGTITIGAPPKHNG